MKHIVVAGEDIFKIAEVYYGNGLLWRYVYEANREQIGDDPENIQPGMVLQIPEIPRFVLPAYREIRMGTERVRIPLLPDPVLVHAERLGMHLYWKIVRRNDIQPGRYPEELKLPDEKIGRMQWRYLRLQSGLNPRYT